VGATGVVNSITVTNGGSGYLPMQFANGGTAATVIISNGLIQNVQYR
jgi:hypothetical protein